MSAMHPQSPEKGKCLSISTVNVLIHYLYGDFKPFFSLQIYHVKEPHSLDKTHFLNDVRDDYQPFPKLEKALTDIDIDVGFNVELKWTMQLQVINMCLNLN